VWEGTGPPNDLERTLAMRKSLHKSNSDGYTASPGGLNTRCRRLLTHERTCSQERRTREREKSGSKLCAHRTTQG